MKKSAVQLVRRHSVQRRGELKGQQDAVVGKFDMQRRKAAIDRACAFCVARAGIVRYIRYFRIGIDRKRGDIKKADPPSVRQRGSALCRTSLLENISFFKWNI